MPRCLSCLIIGQPIRFIVSSNCSSERLNFHGLLRKAGQEKPVWNETNAPAGSCCLKIRQAVGTESSSPFDHRNPPETPIFETFT